MHRRILPPLLFFLTIPVLSAPFPEPDPYTVCHSPFTCGGIGEISYPFWDGTRPDYCGHPGFELENCQGARPTMEIWGLKYRVLGIEPKMQTLTIARIDLSESLCPNRSIDTTFDPSLFQYTPNDENVTLLYHCTSIPSEISPFLHMFPCDNGDEAYMAVGLPLMTGLAAGCGVGVVVPVLTAVVRGGSGDESVAGWVSGAMEKGFEVRWSVDADGSCRDCAESGGKCGYNSSLKAPCCFCPDGSVTVRICRDGLPDSRRSSAAPPPGISDASGGGKGHGRDWVLKTVIGVVAAILGMGMMCLFFFLYQRRRNKRYVISSLLSRNISSGPSMKMDSEKGGHYMGVHIFTYAELEEATNNFDSAKELGDGGFGTVYQGKLQDGRSVAVKRLYENNYRRLEQFMNEVEILTRLRHHNLVSLYGCTSRHSRELLLVYEYIPNGTVADHLHGDRAKSGPLTWPIRMSIALETASALSYLHASDIIHRDVKTNNILLDSNFCVKVADFGLSRLFPNDVTHISTAPQGTPGYVDPEYHQCYQLTDKSDVYSFGVVLMELISSKPAVDITRHRHEINLSNMAITKIQNHTLHELVDPCLGYETEYKARKMIGAVAELAFQCLQNEKEMRPSMEEVLETLNHIQSDGSNVEKAGEREGDVPGDDAVLLKSKALTLSPDTVTVNWTSRATTPNASN